MRLVSIVALLALAAACESSSSPSAPASSVAEVPAAVDGSELPPACSEYRRVMGLLASCETFSSAMRDSLRGDFAAMERQFTTVAQHGSMPPASKQAMANQCSSAVAGIKKAAGAICGF